MSNQLKLPRDKSISHRALFLSVLAEEPVVVRGLNQGRDVAATLDLVRLLGVKVQQRGPEILLSPSKPSDHLGTVNCLNSGTTMRVGLGLLAGLGSKAILVGDSSLMRRPMNRVVKPLCQAGALISTASGGFPPLNITSGIHQRVQHDSPVASAQVKTALILAGLAGGYPVEITEPSPSRDHTERLLAWLGLDILNRANRITLRPGSVPGFEMNVPQDPSAAAFFALLALLKPGLELEFKDLCLNPTRMGFFRILQRMGASVSWQVLKTKPEPVGTMTVRFSGPLKGVSVSHHEVASCVDEIPILGLLASVVEGKVVVRGAAELRVKESDRIGLLVQNLRLHGADVVEFPDGFEVSGPYRFKPGPVMTKGDHRIAMAFAAACAANDLDCQIDVPAAPEVSFPGFYTCLREALA